MEGNFSTWKKTFMNNLIITVQGETLNWFPFPNTVSKERISTLPTSTKGASWCNKQEEEMKDTKTRKEIKVSLVSQHDRTDENPAEY